MPAERRANRYGRLDSMALFNLQWHGTASLDSKGYVCGYCGERVASSTGYFDTSLRGTILICPHCTGPTIFMDTQEKRVIPGSLYGDTVEHVPESVSGLYDEARRALSVDAFTSSVLASRKLLMNVAVEHGAGEGKSFADYIDYLGNAGYVPPNGKVWLDRIRQTGNEATHEIAPKTREDAEQLIAFTGMLLKFIYEFPAKAQPT
jgi:hypothetical protein